MAKNNLNVLMIISVLIFIPLVLYMTNKLDFIETFDSTSTPQNEFSTSGNSEKLSKKKNCKANGNDEDENEPKCPEVPDMSLYVLKSSLPPKMECPPCICPKVKINSKGCEPDVICPKNGYTQLVSTTQKPSLDQAVGDLLHKYKDKDFKELETLEKIQDLMNKDTIGDLDPKNYNSILDENKHLKEQLTQLLKPKPTKQTVDIQDEINKMLNSYNENPDQLTQLRMIKNLLDQSSLETTGELEDDVMGLEGSNEELQNRNKNLQKQLKQLKEQMYSLEHQTTSKPQEHHKNHKRHNGQHKEKPLDTLINQMVSSNGKGNYETPGPNNLPIVDNLTGYHNSVYKAWDTSDNRTCT